MYDRIPSNDTYNYTNAKIAIEQTMLPYISAMGQVDQHPWPKILTCRRGKAVRRAGVCPRLF